MRRLGVWRAFRTVGFVSWGSYAGFFTGSAIYAGIERLSLLWLLDRTIPTILLCSVLGRIGCLTYGCCFGRSWAHGIRWHAPESKVVRQFGTYGARPRIPVQLLSACATALAVLVAALVSLRPAPAGLVTGVVMLLYAVGRFGVDSLRDATFALPRAGGMNLGRVSSGIVAAVATALILSARGEAAWPRSMFSFNWSLLPVVVTVTVLAFLVSGLQWRRVGQW